MKVIEHINGFQTRINNQGLTVRIRNKYVAWRVKNKVELEGYQVSIKEARNNYQLFIWGANLADTYLLNNLEGYAT
jgi:hypothetical protein